MSGLRVGTVTRDIEALVEGMNIEDLKVALAYAKRQQWPARVVGTIAGTLAHRQMQSDRLNLHR